MQRLTGIDLFRGIAVYGVAILHSGDLGGNEATTGWVGIIRHFSNFAVPFFLATSFYLTINRLYTNKYRYSLNSRLSRLLIPYAIWSIIYLALKLSQYWILHQSDELGKIFQDPISLIFLGGGHYHLYFIPLLLTGTVIVKIAEYFIRHKVNLKTLVLLLMLVTTIYELMLVSGNSFILGPNIAFQEIIKVIFPNGNSNPLLRFLLVELSWTLRCLPYIFVAMILSHSSVHKYFLNFNYRHTTIIFLTFVFVNLFKLEILPQSIYEVIRGYISLSLAIGISSTVKENHLVKNIGVCSFGIYLMHALVIAMLKIIANKFYPNLFGHVSVVTVLTFASLSFMLSWAVTYSIILKKKEASKLIFGV